MYLVLSPTAMIAFEEIIGIFDLDNITQSHRTRLFLARGEQAGQVRAASEELPKSLVVCARNGTQQLWLAQPNPATLKGRIEQAQSWLTRPQNKEDVREV